MNVKGSLKLVSVGPGFAEQMTEIAKQALSWCDYVIAYDFYLKWIKSLVGHAEIITLPLTQERERAKRAVELARQGKKVALISGGDIGVYAMAAAAFEEMQESDTFDLEILPGVTAATACASILGAPLSHDFATLSLSDLLCPWQWIEERAKHIAIADLSVVFYNVQSERRQEGVYKILKIMLEYKSPQTVCGVVSNAYRENQSSYICTLDELLTKRFDMNTSIIIGNKYTSKKRNWIYTQRGYGSWDFKLNDQSNVDLTNSIPKHAIWVFSGTTDGNKLARKISESKLEIPVIVSAATDHGAEIAKRDVPGAFTISGKLGQEKRQLIMSVSSAQVIVDATHPYSVQMSHQLMEIANNLSIPYIRFERPSISNLVSPYEKSIICQSPTDAAKQAIEIGNRIFLATGAKELESFLQADNFKKCTWFVRTTPDPEFINKAIQFGLPRANICSMQGPFSKELNILIWKQWQIDCVITKDSGAAGGYEAKVEAARVLNIPLITVSRPRLKYPKAFDNIEQIHEWVFQICKLAGVK